MIILVLKHYEAGLKATNTSALIPKLTFILNASILFAYHVLDSLDELVQRYFHFHLS